MKIRYIKLAVLSMFFLTYSMTSCVGDLDVTPIDPSEVQEFDQDGVFAKIYATLALTGQKGPDGNGDVSGIDEGASAFYRMLFSVNEYSTDEAIWAYPEQGLFEIDYISWTSANETLKGLYNRLYFDVTLCNHFLEQTEGFGDTKSVKQRAEARFMRALNYYYLMDIYANVPFTEVVATTPPPRIERADLFKYIETELLAIEGDMSEPRQGAYGRADKAACWLLLSRLYLNAEVYTGSPRWTDAATYAKKVIDSPYELSPVYAHLFMADNDGSSAINRARQEIILPIFQDGIKTISYGGSTFLINATRLADMNPWGTTDSWACLRARKNLVEKFFPNSTPPVGLDENNMVASARDDRAMFFSIDRTLEIDQVGDFKQGFSVAKFTNLRADGGATASSTWPDLDIPFFRLGEAYLTYAEAILRSGGDAGQALWAVNMLRARANTANLVTVNLSNVLDERARELYFEGHRRTDLVRYGYFTSNAYVWTWKGGTKAGSSVSSIYNICPIPASDLNANPNLIQNPGY